MENTTTKTLVKETKQEQVKETKTFVRLRDLTMDEIKKTFTDKLKVKFEKRVNKKGTYTSYSVIVYLHDKPLITTEVDSKNIDSMKFLNAQLLMGFEDKDYKVFLVPARFTKGTRNDELNSEFYSVEFALHEQLKFSALIDFYTIENLRILAERKLREPINWVDRGTLTEDEDVDIFGTKEE